MSDFDYGSFFTSPAGDGSPDWLQPSSGGSGYDQSVFADYYAGGLTDADFDGGNLGTLEQMIAASNAALWQPDPMNQTFQPTGYHDPVYMPEDVIDANDSNYGTVSNYPTYSDPTFQDFGTVNTGLEDINIPVYTDTPQINQLPQTPVNSSNSGSDGDWLGSFVTGVTALAAAAMKLIPTIQALKNSDVIKSGTTTGAGNVITANNNGTITQRNGSTGAVSTIIPPVGTAYQTPDGNIITNNGNGTYTVVRPDGTRYTGNYTATSTTGGGLTTTGGSISQNDMLLYGGLALAAMLLLKGK